MSFLSMVIDNLVHRLTFKHTLVLFKESKSTIDGRLVNTGELPMNIVYDFLSCEVIAFVMDII